METKYLWDIIDKLRNMNLVIMSESIEQIKDNKKLQAEINRLKGLNVNNTCILCEDYDDGLIAKIKELKAENNKSREYILHLETEITKLTRCDLGNL